MTLNDIRNAAAAYLHRAVTDFTVNGVDLSLFALNQIRRTAELQNDFNFTRRLMTLFVDGTVGGSLSGAMDWFTQQPYEIKSIVDVGQWDQDRNLNPVEWTTVAASLDIQRMEGSPPFRYPTDGQAMSGMNGAPRVVFSGDTVFLSPKAPGQDFEIGFEVYTFSQDWTIDDYTTSPDPWASKGSQYLMWMLVIHLNQVFKDFVFRQEGNLPPPQTLADQGLAALIAWDIFKYEQSRRHNR
jgi:hypothetical protein